MTPAEIKSCRQACGLDQAGWAIALGYRSADRKNLRQQVNDMEGGRKPITAQIARLAEMYRRFGVPADMMEQDRAAP